MERREALITGLVLGVMFAVIAGLFAYGRSTDTLGGIALEGSVTEDSAEPDESESDPPDPSPDELDAFVDDAVAFVEETRGRSFVTEPVVVTLDEAAFVERIQESLDGDLTEDADEVEMFNAVYRSLGLIGADEDIDEVYRRFGAAGVLGFYDPETDELVVRQRDELSLLTKSTIVHELTHAFDDQHFDLDRPEYDDRTDEVPWAFRAVVEGSASWVEAEWESTLSTEERSDLLFEELDFADPGIFDQFELSFLFLELSPYDYGEDFVEHLIDGGGNDALDEALVDPPITSEQVISPGRYDAKEGPIPMAAPPADGEVQFSGLGGQVLIDSLFAPVGVQREFGWGGDQLVVWTSGEESCFRWDVRADDATTADISSAFENWGVRVGGTDVTTVDDFTVRIERCV